MKVVGAPQGTSQSQSDSCGMPRQRVIGLKVVISVHEEAATGCERKLPQSMQALPVSLPVSLHPTLCPCTLHYLHVPQTRFTHLTSLVCVQEDSAHPFSPRSTSTSMHLSCVHATPLCSVRLLPMSMLLGHASHTSTDMCMCKPYPPSQDAHPCSGISPSP
jgi:hypothetical protein